MSIGFSNEILIEEENINNISTINPEFLIQQSTDGRDIYEDILGDGMITLNGSYRMRGTIYTMTTDRYLIEQQAYLGIDESTTLHFVVYECYSGICSLISQTIIDDSGIGEGYYSSGATNIFLENGNTYAIGYAFEGNVGYGMGDYNQDTSFGIWAGCMYDAYVEYYPPPDNFVIAAWGGAYNAKFFTSDEPINDDSGCADTPGDLNSDGIVNILDILAMIDCTLEYNCDECSDLNEDGYNNILDILQLVNIILDN